MIMSQEFLDTLKGKHGRIRRTLRVTSLTSGDDISGVVVDGSSQYQGNRVFRGSCSFQVVNKGGAYNLRTDSIFFMFERFFVECGLVVLGETVWIPMGVYTIDSPEQENMIVRGNMLRLSASDLMSVGAASSWTSPEMFAYTQTVNDVIDKVATDAGLPAERNLNDGGATLGTNIVADLDNNRVTFMDDLAYNNILSLYMDDLGVLTLIPTPDPTLAVPVDSYVRGPDNVLVSSSRTMTAANWYNHTVVVGEDRYGYPVRGEARDDNPLSVGYWGRIGDRVKPTRFSALVTDNDQAERAALQDLWAATFVDEAIKGSVITNPALRPDDAVEIVDDVMDINDVYVLTNVVVPWRRGQATLDSQKRRALS